jgi:DNA-binding NarL/FixJ family response regulator
VPLARAEARYRRTANRRARPVRILVAHGQRLARAGLRLLIERDDALTVAGDACTGEQVVALARRRLPDVVVMDLDLPGHDALEATRQIVRDPALTGVRILVLTSAESDESILAPVRAGAAGVLLRDSEPAELLDAMRLLASGEGALSPSLLSAVLADVASRPEPRWSSPEGLSELTAREREVVALVAFGLSNGDIAQHLVISPATARTHVSRAMRKLSARDRAQLVAFAYRTGLATAADPEPAVAPTPPATRGPDAVTGRRNRFGAGPRVVMPLGRRDAVRPASA